jgi:flagellar biosynthetic protein FliR
VGQFDIGYGDLFAGFLVFVRIMAFVAVAPLLSASAVNARVQTLLGLALTFALLPFVVDTVPALPTDDSVWIAVLGIQEVLAGALMGFAFTLLIGAVQMAGQAMGSTIGLAMANVLDPATNAQVNVLSQFFSLLAVVVFIAMDGHYMFLKLMVESFERVPVGSVALAEAGARTVIEAGGHLFELGVRLALPVLLSLLLVYGALGIMSRAAPQIQVFFVMHPLNIALGLFVFSASLGVAVTILREEFEGFIAQGLELLMLLGGA